MQKIECAVIDGTKYFILVFIYIVLGTLLSAAIAWKSHHFFFIWIGLLIFWGLPVIFQKQFQKPFSKQANFVFSTDNLQVKIFSDNQSEKECALYFSEIAAFRAMESYKDESAYLKLYARDGRSFKYNLIHQSSVRPTEVIASVFEHFKNYNNSTSDEQSKITLRPSLFSTPPGKMLILILSLLLLVSIAIQIAFLRQSLPASLLTGLALYIIILQQRRIDIQLNKRLKD